MAQPIELVLSLLSGVKKSGVGFMACCPAHDDRSPSLSVKEGDDGRVLIHCFAGCTFNEVVASLGLNAADLFVNQGNSTCGDFRPLRLPVGKLQPAIELERQILFFIHCDRLKGRAISSIDCERELIALQRLTSVKDFL
jgi:hypothetical protein